MKVNRITQNQNNNPLNFKGFTGVKCKGFESEEIVKLIEEKIDNAIYNPLLRDIFIDYDIGVTLRTIHKENDPVYSNYFRSTCTITKKPEKGINRLRNLLITILPSKKIVIENEGGYTQKWTEEGLKNKIDFFEQEIIEKAKNKIKL